jgi:hypothetical protein
VRWKQKRAMRLDPETEIALARAFAGQYVSQIIFDYAVTIVGEVQRDTLRIETAFDLHTPASEIIRVDPEHAAPAAGQMLALLHLPVIAVHLSDQAELAVSFNGGWRITIPPHDQYEAWNLQIEDGPWFIYGPDGEISWFPHRGTAHGATA